MTIGSGAVQALRRVLPRFEDAYCRYNHRKFVSPDPLETLYPFSRVEDREIVAFLVSCIAYGRVAMILRNASRLLDILGEEPAEFLRSASSAAFEESTASFRHRFTTGREIGALILGMRKVLREYGSLESLFSSSMEKEKTTLGALSGFVEVLRDRSAIGGKFLLPSPRDGSACKRLFLFLKWMVRDDGVDPGGWTILKARDLLIPMDVHMFRMCASLGLTGRRQADLRTAVEVTDVFRTVLPDDPVKYDFVLTRFGIRREMSEKEFLELCLEGECHEDRKA